MAPGDPVDDWRQLVVDTLSHATGGRVDPSDAEHAAAAIIAVLVPRVRMALYDDLADALNTQGHPEVASVLEDISDAWRTELGL